MGIAMQLFRRAVALLSIAGSVACGGSPEAPTAVAVALSATADTAHFVFHYAPTDSVDAPRQEAFYDWFTPLFGITAAPRIQYYKHPTRSHLLALTGQNTNGFADTSTSTIHTIWPFEPHEAIHIYTATIGRPTDFFNEGIAVGLSTDPMAGRFVPWWNAQPVDAVVRGLRSTGRVPALAAIAATTPFRALDDQISYPTAGSFLAFVVDRYGIESTKAFFRSGARDDEIDRIRTTFQTAFGVGFEAAEQAWLLHVDAQ